MMTRKYNFFVNYITAKKKAEKTFLSKKEKKKRRRSYCLDAMPTNKLNTKILYEVNN